MRNRISIRKIPSHTRSTDKAEQHHQLQSSSISHQPLVYRTERVKDTNQLMTIMGKLCSKFSIPCCWKTNKLEIPCIKEGSSAGQPAFAFKSTVIQGFQLVDNRQTNSTALGAQVFLQTLHKMLMTKSAGLMPRINLSESYPKRRSEPRGNMLFLQHV